MESKNIYKNEMALEAVLSGAIHVLCARRNDLHIYKRESKV